jgi:hypothetical protein
MCLCRTTLAKDHRTGFEIGQYHGGHGRRYRGFINAYLKALSNGELHKQSKDMCDLGIRLFARVFPFHRHSRWLFRTNQNTGEGILPSPGCRFIAELYGRDTFQKNRFFRVAFCAMAFS